MILLNVSNLPWVPKRMKRNQAIFWHLLQTGKFEAGVYVQPPEVRNLGTHWTLRWPYCEKVDEIESGPAKIAIIQPVFTLPFSYREPLVGLSSAILARALTRIYPGASYVLWMNSIELLATELTAKLAQDAAICIFDSSDDYLQFKTSDPGGAAARLERILRLADRVLAVNEHVASGLNHDTRLVFNNCTDFENFQSVVTAEALPAELQKQPGERFIGFIGGLNNDRIDLPLLQLLFERFPQCKFVFVGYTNHSAVRSWLERFRNASFVPEVPYDLLPGVIRSFDVAIVPHLDNAHTKGNDLLKVLDYFACGVPVVTTKCSNVEKYGNACHIAGSPEEFAGLVEGILQGRIVSDPEPGLSIARSQTWAAKVPGLLSWTLHGSEHNHD